MEQFYTIKNNIEAEIVEKKSKFIANLIKVESKEEAEEKIQEIKKKYYDARHNCVAYRVLEEGKVEEKASDDGEPSGTAGGPMLNILQKNNLSNVLIVVTRYFGGILLGTGGLVRAYSEALKKAIEESTLIMKVSGIEMKLIVDYNNFEKFKYYCKNNNISIISLEYLEKIECKIQMELEKKEKFIKDYENKELNISNLEILSKKIIDKSI
ncbi:MAG: YigZ family protein [Clostridia bacterium]|nr:YigZ family protein [Clostridium sp.]